MAGRKNVFQEYGMTMNQTKGKTIWERNDNFNSANFEVYCKSCGKTIEMPTAEGPGAYSMDTYQLELKHRIHQECARELDRRGIKY